MAVYESKSIRNVALLGHKGNGKTTLTEAMLFNAGAIDRMGKIVDGTTTSDYDPEEIKRNISISASLAPIEVGGNKINLIDAPGFFDLVGEVVQAVSVADSVLAVMSFTSGVKVGTLKALNYATKAGLAKAVFVNKLDRENPGYEKVFPQIRQKVGKNAVPVMLPIMDGMVMTGYVDLIENKAVTLGKAAMDIPANMADSVAEYREMLLEASVENDEDLMEKYFAGEELTVDELKLGLKKGIVSGTTMPVLCGSAEANWAIDHLNEFIAEYLPSPLEMKGKEGTNLKTNERQNYAFDASAPFAAHVFKTVADPFVGKLSLMKVVSGILSSDMTLYNPGVQKSEKTGGVYIMRGKKQSTVDKVYAGDICALAKLQYTQTGHTLCAQDAPVAFDEFVMPKPTISMAVSPKKQGDEDKAFSGLRRLEEEDLTFTVKKQVETGEMLLWGMGELHLEIIAKKLQNKFNVEVNMTLPKIPYRETIRKAVKAEGKHKKQSGGHGQYGHCVVEFEPIMDGSADFEFVDKIVGGVVPRQYIPAVEKGLRESITKGVLAGYPVVGLRATLVFGSYHDVDSSEMAFKIAAHLAFKKGCKEASPVLLEPIYRMEVLAPDEYTGDIIGDFNKRRGRIMGMEPTAEGQRIIAEVPQAEVFTYATDLRSMTQARGEFEMFFERYEDVPANIAQKVIENAQIEDDDE